MPVVWSPTTRDHDPQNEVWVGVATIGTEVAARVDAILAAVTEGGHPVMEAATHPDDVLARVHDPAMLTFLAEAAERWRQGPYADLVGQTRVVPYLFPTPAMTAGLPTRRAVAIHAEAGSYAYDTMTLVGAGTWEAARAAVDCALTRPTWCSRGSARRTRCAGRPGTTRPRPVSAAPATSTTPRSPPKRCAPAATTGWR